MDSSVLNRLRHRSLASRIRFPSMRSGAYLLPIAGWFKFHVDRDLGERWDSSPPRRTLFLTAPADHPVEGDVRTQPSSFQ